MTEHSDHVQSTNNHESNNQVVDKTPDEVAALRDSFQSRLLTASLRAEAIRAGMIDLDGLKLIDRSGLKLNNDDTLVEGRKVMEVLRERKPWLFGVMSSSSASLPPAAQPVKQKTAMEMTDSEYAIARAAVIKHRF